MGPNENNSKIEALTNALGNMGTFDFSTVKTYCLIEGVFTDAQLETDSVKTLLRNNYDIQHELKWSRGYVVGIYENNGEVDEVTAIRKDGGLPHEYEIPKNLVGMGYIRKDELDKSGEFNYGLLKSLLSSMAGQYLSEFSGIYGDAVFGKLSKAVSSLVKANDVMENYTGEKLTISMLETVDNSRKLLIQDDIKDLFSEADLKGMSDNQREKVKTIETAMSCATLFLGLSMAQGVIVGGSIYAVTQAFNSKISQLNGDGEYDRYIQRLDQNGKIKDQYFYTLPNESINESLEYGFDSVRADGDTNTIFGNSNNNYIEALRGNDTETGDDDTIILNDIFRNQIDFIQFEGEESESIESSIVYYRRT